MFLRARWSLSSPLAAAVLLGLLLSVIFSAGPLAAQQPAVEPPTAAAGEQPKPLAKVYIVGYLLVAMMIGLGLLVVCRASPRQERPDLPQEEIAERLRHRHTRPPASRS
jgi:hypothetical protein